MGSWGRFVALALIGACGRIGFDDTFNHGDDPGAVPEGAVAEWRPFTSQKEINLGPYMLPLVAARGNTIGVLGGQDFILYSSRGEVLVGPVPHGLAHYLSGWHATSAGFRFVAHRGREIRLVTLSPEGTIIENTLVHVTPVDVFAVRLGRSQTQLHIGWVDRRDDTYQAYALRTDLDGVPLTAERRLSTNGEVWFDTLWIGGVDGVTYALWDTFDDGSYYRAFGETDVVPETLVTVTDEPTFRPRDVVLSGTGLAVPIMSYESSAGSRLAKISNPTNVSGEVVTDGSCRLAWADGRFMLGWSKGASPNLLQAHFGSMTPDLEFVDQLQLTGPESRMMIPVSMAHTLDGTVAIGSTQDNGDGVTADAILTFLLP